MDKLFIPSFIYDGEEIPLSVETNDRIFDLLKNNAEVVKIRIVLITDDGCIDQEWVLNQYAVYKETINER